MQALLKNKMTVGFVLLLLVVWLGYRQFSNSATSLAEEGSALSVGQDLLDMANRLSAAELSQELLSDRSYIFLNDFSLPIPQQSFGRTNPFDLIGR